MILIDGHNLLFKIDPDFKSKIKIAVEEQTNALVRLLSAKKTTLIYDGTGGRGEYGYKEKKLPSLTVVYSGAKQSADDWIVDWVKTNKGTMCSLVSDDLKLRKRIQSIRHKKNGYHLINDSHFLKL